MSAFVKESLKATQAWYRGIDTSIRKKPPNLEVLQYSWKKAQMLLICLSWSHFLDSISIMKYKKNSLFYKPPKGRSSRNDAFSAESYFVNKNNVLRK